MKITILSNLSSESENEQFALDVLTGLCEKEKRLPAKYFYDDTGSHIFQKISQHEDYYLTKTEFEILNSVKHKIPELINDKQKKIDILELGAGDGHKTQLLIDGFLASGYEVNFYPVDISEKAMSLLEKNIKPHQNLSIHAVVGDYFEGVKFVRKQSKNKLLVLFLGSNIGNFDRVQNQGFLRHLWMNLNALDYLLIGFDLKKDVTKLINAYNDSSGYTKDFNLNLLERINRELGANFDLEKFQHYGVYNPVLGAMESYVLSMEEQEVYISSLERVFGFSAFEAIHFEYSFKFLPADISYLASNNGFEHIMNFSDQEEYFVDSLWQVTKKS